ncbi:hypothetical protein N7465_003920 [Penicillium sp. CMV-2018d]|nr:hypothetical protein N7465_003920 [Penicillium sp. CMV-2018d]
MSSPDQEIQSPGLMSDLSLLPALRFLLRLPVIPWLQPMMPSPREIGVQDLYSVYRWPRRCNAVRPQSVICNCQLCATLEEIFYLSGSHALNKPHPTPGHYTPAYASPYRVMNNPTLHTSLGNYVYGNVLYTEDRISKNLVQGRLGNELSMRQS